MKKTDAKKPANRQTSGKRGGKNEASWQPGQSGNPAGRPKDGESWSAIFASVGNMYPQDILDFIGTTNDLGRMIAGLPRGVQIKYLTIIRVFSALLFEPSQGLLKEVMERIEGKVQDKLQVSGDAEAPLIIKRLGVDVDKV